MYSIFNKMTIPDSYKSIYEHIYNLSDDEMKVYPCLKLNNKFIDEYEISHLNQNLNDIDKDFKYWVHVDDFSKKYDLFDDDSEEYRDLIINNIDDIVTCIVSYDRDQSYAIVNNFNVYKKYDIKDANFKILKGSPNLHWAIGNGLLYFYDYDGDY